jgi:phage repressor protein C with HTH and peptisase S24 domain
MTTPLEFGQKIREVRQSKNLSVRQVATDANLSFSYLSKIENGHRKIPSNQFLERLAKGLHVDVADVFAWAGVTDKVLSNQSNSIATQIYNVSVSLHPARQKRVYSFAEQQYHEQNNVIDLPAAQNIELYGAVSAGTGEYLLDGKPEVVEYDGDVPDHDFAVVVNGDSMLPLFEDKQIIFVKKTTEVRSGQIVIADYDQQAYVKKFMQDGTCVRLVSLNKKYDDLPINEDHEFSVFGVVVL